MLGAYVLCSAVAGQHVHTLSKLPEGVAREWAGKAKQHAWHVARANGWQGRLWAKRGKEIRVRDRSHQLNIYKYILQHAEDGAWIWKHGEAMG